MNYTKDINEAAYLLTLGYDLENFNNEGSIVYFIFRKDINKDIKKFYMGDKVNAFDFSKNLRYLKKQIHKSSN